MFCEYPDILTIEQLQEALHIGRSMAYFLIRSDQIKSLRIGKAIRIPKKYLIDYVQSQCYNSDMVIDSPSTKEVIA